MVSRHSGISGSGTSASDAGFTLLEVLTVVFIIGLVTGGIIFLVPPPDSALDREVARLELTITTLSERAVLTGVAQGLLVRSTGYDAMQYEQGRWVALPQYVRELPSEVRASSNVNLNDEATEPTPQYIFDPIGLPNEGAVTLLSGSDDADIRLGVQGPV